MQRHILAACVAASLFSACGGGGGGGSSPPSTAASVTLGGAAVKGPMKNADVSVYAVGAGGVPATTPLATGTTGDDGSYTLHFDGTKDQPYVVVVKAKADGSTTHIDEVSGATQSLPKDFTMRALVIPASSGNVTTSATITPFSEMAVAAAEKKAGGITAANARQASSTMTQMLGFDPTAVRPKNTSDASDDEKRLGAMLTAVSKLASDGKLGCTTGTASDKTQCVVAALRASASSDSITLGSTGIELGAALTQVLADPALNKGSVTSALLGTVQANLHCTSNCEAAPPSTVTAVAAARALFTSIATDWKSLFSRGGASSIASGAANAQALKFSNELPKLNQPVTTMLLDTNALVMGAKLFKDYQSGATSSPERSEGQVPVLGDSFTFQFIPETNCGLYQDAATNVLATAVANAAFVGCAVRYSSSATVIAGGFRRTDYRHGFVMAPKPDGTFSWESRARKSIYDCTPTCVRTTNDNLEIDPITGSGRVFTGNATPVLTSGQLAQLALAGEFPAAFDSAGFVSGGYSLTNDRHVVSINVSQTLDPSTGQPAGGAISGSFAAKDSSGATVATLLIKDGSRIETMPVRYDSQGHAVAPDAPSAGAASGFEISGFTLDLLLSTPGAQFEGIFSATDSTWDRSLTSSIPTRLSFTGILTTITEGVATDFLTGTFTALATGYAAFDATQLQNLATNHYTQDVKLVGAVTAPNRPRLELTFSATAQTNSHDYKAQGATLQYRSIVAGQPRTVVNVTASPNPTTGEIDHFKLTESTANLSIDWNQGDSTVTLKSGDVEIGTLEADSGLITFKDHSIMSLAIGL